MIILSLIAIMAIACIIVLITLGIASELMSKDEIKPETFYIILYLCSVIIIAEVSLIMYYFSIKC
jgi:hypothetical protein